MMSSTMPGTLSLTDDSQSADGQLQLGLQLIQQSYTRRAGYVFFINANEELRWP